MTHEAPSITGHNCSVGEKTQSKTMGQRLRWGKEHIDIFKLRAPQNSSESLTVATGFGLMKVWGKCERKKRMKKGGGEQRERRGK